jgi:hypothetical protein
MRPTFPITVLHEDGERWDLATPDELAATVEWFDSDESDGSMTIVDAQGRLVRLKVVALEIQRLEVDDGPPVAVPAPETKPKRRKAPA